MNEVIIYRGALGAIKELRGTLVAHGVEARIVSPPGDAG